MALRDLVQQYDIKFKKRLGQNLLLDDNINRIMVDAAALTKEDDVIEIGAGLGMLTEHIHPQVGRVFAVEIDQSFMPCLEDRFGGLEHVRLFRGDILNHELGKLLDEFLPGYTTPKLISNLPYYITTPILFHFWESSVPFSRLVVMVQEEVAMRMVAAVNARDYGILSLASQLFADVDIVHRVPRTCFKPEPKVDSSIVRFRMRETPRYPDIDSKFLLRVIRSAFSQRRKTLRNSLTRSGTFGAPKEAVLDALNESGIDSARRPQTLSLQEFADLARAIRKRIE